MDTTAQRARDREAFREFLERHRYAPQGRFARTSALEDKDIDALSRGALGPVWAWAWRNIKNAEDMEIIKRNVAVARHGIDSCKQEREQAKEKRETLVNRKKQLEEELHTAREREQSLLASVRGLEDEQEALVQSASDKKQRELLRKAFNDKNDDAMNALGKLIDQVQWIVTTYESHAPEPQVENQIEILLDEVKRMLKTSKNAVRVDFGDSDINYLRDSSGTDLIKWLLESASRPHEDVPEDDEDAKYAAHVEEQSSTSHDALVQIQNLLRQSQAEHIASFVNTQKVYAKATELKSRVEEATAPDTTPYGLWGNENGEQNASGDAVLAAQTVDLQIQSQANVVALNYATRTFDDIAKQVGTHRQQKQELEHKIELMNQFDERQQDIVAQIRSKFRHNQELLQSLSHKQSRLLQIITDESLPRIEHDSDAELTEWSKFVMDELRAFSSVRLRRQDIGQKQLSVPSDAITEHARQAHMPVPFEEFYINQLQRTSVVDGLMPSQSPEQQPRNGYQRVAQALRVPTFASWAAILASLRETVDENAATPAEISEAFQQLEHDVSEDRSHTAPDAQALLNTLQQVTEAMTRASLSRLEDVVHVNTETMQRSVPELDQVIDNWFHQPAWSARVERDASTCSSSGSLASSAIDISDLLR